MPDPYKDAGRVLLRSGVGGVLVAHGCQKLFGWFGGGGPQGAAKAFESMRFHPGMPSAIAAGVGEAGGGACLVLGLGMPLAASAASGTMLAAAVHAPAGFFAQSGGYEYAAMLGVYTAALALTGPGEWSLDRALGYPLNKPWMSIAALIASAAGAAVVLQRRKRALAVPRTASEVAA